MNDSDDNKDMLEMCPRPTDQEVEQMPTVSQIARQRTTAEILQKLN